jgi:N-acetylneuraminic acid mutarotase
MQSIILFIVSLVCLQTTRVVCTQWEQILPTQNNFLPRFAAASATLGSKAYLFGGAVQDNFTLQQVHNDLYEFDLQDDFFKLTPLAVNATNRPTARKGAGMAAIDGYLFIAGGDDASDDLVDDTAWLYSIDKDEWTSVGITTMPTRREAVVFVFEGDFYVHGGSMDDSSGGLLVLNDVWKYSVQNDKWTQLPSNFTLKYGARVAQIDDSDVYVYGGYNDYAQYQTAIEFADSADFIIETIDPANAPNQAHGESVQCVHTSITLYRSLSRTHHLDNCLCVVRRSCRH